MKSSAVTGNRCGARMVIQLWASAQFRLFPLHGTTHYECEKGPEMMGGNRKLSDIFPGQ
jgi:hypothetical protein